MKATIRMFVIAVGLAVLAGPVSATVLSGPGGNGVPVGSSSLINTLGYSDTWTQTAFGGNPGRVDGAYPVGSPGINVENTYGNPAVAWTNSKWSINRDGTVGVSYPGGSGAGSATGITQSGGDDADWGIEYGLRRDFVVQFDAVQTWNRVDITAGNARDTIGSANGLSVFFRAVDGETTVPEVGLYNVGLGETSTGFDTALAGVNINEWHNYAVHFNLNALQLGVYVDEILLGTIDLATFAGGAYAAVVNANTDDAVSVGFGGPIYAGVFWSDNFQVGAAVVPEPSIVCLLAVGGLFLRRRVKRE